MNKKNILFLILMLIIFFPGVGQKFASVQFRLDSLLRLSPQSTKDKFEYYGKSHKVGNGFFITNALRSFNCNGHLCTEERKGIIKPSGDTIVPSFTRILPISGKQLFLSSDQFNIICDFSFRVITSFDKIEFSDDGFYKVMQEGKFGMTDKNFNVIIPVHYDFVQPFDLNGRAVVRTSSGGWKILDQDSLLTGKSRVEEYGRMIELIKINENGKWGFINEGGQLVTGIKYNAAVTFPGGYAAASGKGESDISQWAILNYEGKELTPFKYDKIVQHYNWHYTLASIHGLYGFIDEKGKEATSFIYTSVGDDFFYHPGLGNYVVVQDQNGKSGVINQQGKEIVPLIYEAIQGCWDCEGGLQGKINNEWKDIPLPIKK